MKPLPLRVSDHAVLRYLERVGGFEIEALRAAIAARVGRCAIPGAHSVKIDGNQYLLAQGPDALVVVTVLESGHRAVHSPKDGP